MSPPSGNWLAKFAQQDKGSFCLTAASDVCETRVSKRASQRDQRAGIAMAYKLCQLAPGSYDVLLNGVIIASLVRSGETDNATWTAELLVDLPPEERPVPFTEAEHSFGSLEEAQEWLGGAEIRDVGQLG
jgi:hypothetical protein